MEGSKRVYCISSALRKRRGTGWEGSFCSFRSTTQQLNNLATKQLHLMSDTIITVDKLSKRYRLGQIGATSLREEAERVWENICRRRKPTTCRLEDNGNRQHVVAGMSVAEESSEELWARARARSIKCKVKGLINMHL